MLRALHSTEVKLVRSACCGSACQLSSRTMQSCCPPAGTSNSLLALTGAADCTHAQMTHTLFDEPTDPNRTSQMHNMLLPIPWGSTVTLPGIASGTARVGM